jgi:hypothetical protein
MMPKPLRVAIFAAIVATACARYGVAQPAENLLRAWAPSPDTFPLDDLPRTVDPEGKIRCPKVDLVSHRGTAVRYHSPVRVYAGFKPRLELFEEVVRDVALEIYGRAPSKIRHLGTINCRRIRRWPAFLSEHGLGNAIDVAAFEFAPLKRKAKAPTDLQPQLRRAFSVSVKRNWDADAANALALRHQRFLHTLATRLIERKDIFRVLLGPAYPGHQDHFHLDCAPWRLVDVFEQAS